MMIFMYFLQMDKKLVDALNYVVSQMQATTKKLQDIASFCYTDEDVVDGFMVAQVARSIDELAKILDVTSMDCHFFMMDPIAVLEACRRFEIGGSLGRRVKCRCVPQPRWVGARPSAKGGERWSETGVREVEIPRPSCSSRAQVGCACSRGLQASTREREASGLTRAPVSSSSPRGQRSVRGPWSFLL
jgi:hypothetical protein